AGLAQSRLAPRGRQHRRMVGASMSQPMPTLLVDSRCAHGEGVVWCPHRQALLWVDIDGAQLWLHRPGDGLTRQWSLPDRPGCIGLVEDGSLLLALAKG